MLLLLLLLLVVRRGQHIVHRQEYVLFLFAREVFLSCGPNNNWYYLRQP